MKNRNWFWGVFFILAAIFVVVSQTAAFGQFGFWSILASIILITLMVKSITKHSFFGVFIPLALLYLIYQQPFNLVKISFWLLILAAILLSIGCNFIFRRHPHKMIPPHGKHDRCAQTIENIDDNSPVTKVSFGSSSKYLHADALKNGQFTVSFGELAVYFDQVELSSEGAEIYVDCNCGVIKLYLPQKWRIVERITTSLGGVNSSDRYRQPEDNAPQLTITGNVQLGEIEIHYV